MEGGEKLGFGFKIAGKARPKVAVNVVEKTEHRQLITGVAGSVIQAAEPAPEDKQFVIPALQNTYKTGVGKFVPTFVPESTAAPVTGNAEDRYERAAVGEQPAITSFGLEVRQRKKDASAAAAAAADGEAGGAAGPMVPVNRMDDAAKLKADLDVLPEEASVEDYESLPVEEFGKALLRGLGWSDGQGVGRKRQVVEPKQIIRRPDRLGLGANPAAPPPDKRPRKMGEKPREDLVAAPTADGAARHRVGLDEKLVPRSTLLPGPQPGKVMCVVGGDHEGLMARVLELLGQAEGGASGPERVRVELLPSGAEVTVAADELAEKGAKGSTAAAAAAAAAGGSGKDRRLQHREGSREAADGTARGGNSRHRDDDEEQQRQQQRRDDSSRRHRDSSDHRRRDRSRERDPARDRDRERHRDDHVHHKHDREWDSSRQQQQQQRSGSSRHYDRNDDRDGRQRQQQQDESPSSSSGEEAAGQRQQQQHRQQQRAAPRALPPHKLWVASLIRVRVIDKRMQGGRLYLKKGTVLDVAPDGTCDVRLEEGRQVISAHQDQLETVVPKEAGAAVMVVQGQHKGRRGRLLQVNVSGGAAALQLTGDMEVCRLLLDDVAQFMGHLEEEDM